MLFYSELLGAIMNCISDVDPEVRKRAGEANKDLLDLVKVNNCFSYAVSGTRLSFLQGTRQGGTVGTRNMSAFLYIAIASTTTIIGDGGVFLSRRRADEKSI